MRTPLRAAVAAAAIAGAGLAGFGITNAFAQSDGSTTTTTVQPADAPDGARPPGGPGCMGQAPGLTAMADAIGISEDDLRAALEDGQTPAEVAEANGVSRADLVDAIVADINDHLDQAVEDGHLTQAEADQHAADAEEHANALVDGEHPDGPPPGAPGAPGDQAAS